MNSINAEQFLQDQNFDYRKANGELIIHCPLNDCDADSTGKEAHFYIDQETGQFHCKKCNETGNLVTLSSQLNLDISKADTDGSDNNNKISKSDKKDNQEKDTIPPGKVRQYHQDLPDRIKSYLTQDCCISERLIDKYGIGYGEFWGDKWIVFPIYSPEGELLYFKLRQDPRDGDEKRMYKNGSATLFDWHTLQNEDERIVICEGETDKLALESKGVSTVTSTHGANTFKEEWVKEFAGLDELFICFDRDKAGKRGAQRVAQMLVEELDADIYIVNLPDYLPEDGDINDYITKNQEPIGKLWSEYACEYHDKNKKRRIAEVQSPESRESFSEWKNTIDKNFPNLTLPAEISASVVTQLLIKDISKPFPLVLIDVPSSGKTTVLNFFTGIEKLMYTTDKLTPAAMVSHAANKSEEELKETDLLPRIRYKTLLIRDLASVFSKRREDLKESLGILTRVLDGEGFQADSGVHGGRGYSGDYLFMMLAASTPLKKHVWRIMGNLGSRLLFMRPLAPDKSKKKLAKQLREQNYKKKEKVCRQSTSRLLRTLWSEYPDGIEWNKENDSNELLEMIGQAAILLSHLRATINETKSKMHKEESVIVEKPDRINQLLYNLARGHAVLEARNKINEKDIRVVFRVMLDSAQLSRSMSIRALVGSGGKLTTDDVTDKLDVSKPTAHKRMEVLSSTGVAKEFKKGGANQTKEIKLRSKFNWLLSDRFAELMNYPEWLRKNRN